MLSALSVLSLSLLLLGGALGESLQGPGAALDCALYDELREEGQGGEALAEVLLLKASALSSSPASAADVDLPAALSLTENALQLLLTAERTEDSSLQHKASHVHEAVGLLQAALGQPMQAIVSFDSAISTRETAMEQVDGYALLLLHKSFAHIAACQWYEARLTLGSVLSLSPSTLLVAKASGALCVLQLAAGRPAAAIPLIEGSIDALSLPPFSTEVSPQVLRSQLLILRGKSYMQLGEFWQARSSFLMAQSMSHNLDLDDNDGKLMKLRNLAKNWMRQCCHFLLWDSDIQNQQRNIPSFHAAISNDDYSHQLCMGDNTDISEFGSQISNGLPQHDLKDLLQIWKRYPLLNNLYRLTSSFIYVSSFRGPSVASRYLFDQRRVAALSLSSLQINALLQAHITSNNSDIKPPVSHCKLESPSTVATDLKSFHICTQLMCDTQRRSALDFLHIADVALSWGVSAMSPFLSAGAIFESNDVYDESNKVRDSYRSEYDDAYIIFVERGGVAGDHSEYLSRVFGYCKQHILKKGYFVTNSDNQCDRTSLIFLRHHKDRLIVNDVATFEGLIEALNTSFCVPFLSKPLQFDGDKDISNESYTIWDLSVKMTTDPVRSPSSSLCVYMSLPKNGHDSSFSFDTQRSTLLQRVLEDSFGEFVSQTSLINKEEIACNGRTDCLSRLLKSSLKVFYYWSHLSPLNSFWHNDFVGSSMLMASLSYLRTSQDTLLTIENNYTHLFIEALLSSSFESFAQKAKFLSKKTFTSRQSEVQDKKDLSSLHYSKMLSESFEVMSANFSFSDMLVSLESATGEFESQMGGRDWWEHQSMNCSRKTMATKQMSPARFPLMVAFSSKYFFRDIEKSAAYEGVWSSLWPATIIEKSLQQSEEGKNLIRDPQSVNFRAKAGCFTTIQMNDSAVDSESFDVSSSTSLKYNEVKSENMLSQCNYCDCGNGSDDLDLYYHYYSYECDGDDDDCTSGFCCGNAFHEGNGGCGYSNDVDYDDTCECFFYCDDIATNQGTEFEDEDTFDSIYYYCYDDSDNDEADYLRDENYHMINGSDDYYYYYYYYNNEENEDACNDECYYYEFYHYYGSDEEIW